MRSKFTKIFVAIDRSRVEATRADGSSHAHPTVDTKECLYNRTALQMCKMLFIDAAWTPWFTDTGMHEPWMLTLSAVRKGTCTSNPPEYLCTAAYMYLQDPKQSLTHISCLNLTRGCGNLKMTHVVSGTCAHWELGVCRYRCALHGSWPSAAHCQHTAAAGIHHTHHISAHLVGVAERSDRTGDSRLVHAGHESTTRIMSVAELT